MGKRVSGIILKGIGGFYYVQTDLGLLECKARGIFRKNNQKPFIGDYVDVLLSDDNGYAAIETIYPRKNQLIRPPIANIDQLFIIASIANPGPNAVVIDKLIAVAQYNNIEPIVIISKTDLANPIELVSIYELADIKVITTSKKDLDSHKKIKELLTGKTTAFTGNSGVGKSTLLNCIEKDFEVETGAISQRLKRGKHTTRYVELYPLSGGGFIADTPGFSSIDLGRFNMLDKENLRYSFIDFLPYQNDCKFNSCNHIGEKGCAIAVAVQEGKISQSRYDSYLTIYNEIKDIKPWE